MLSKQSPYAIYMPALSAEYARLGHGRNLSRKFSFDESDLNFLDPKSRLFHYPYALYSAGQAAKTDGAAAQHSIVSHRDRDRTTVLGDSGGFQIQQGTIRFDGDTTSERMLRWLEGNTDLSMTLDFPTGGIAQGNVQVHASRLRDQGFDLDALRRSNGLSELYNACLKQSLLNLDYFVTNRKPGATLLLNVIQGRNEQESKAWYDAVKGYGLEGWAFAGAHQSSFTMLLNRLLDMREDGLLGRTRWIHVLGVSKLAEAYLFTVILRCLRRFNPEIELSFDTAGPFRAAAHFQFCTSHRINKHDVTITAQSMPAVDIKGDTRTLNELCAFLAESSPIPDDGRGWAASVAPETPARTGIGEQIKVSDICVGSGGSSALDRDSVLLLMNHNVQAYVNAFAALNAASDENRLQDHVPLRVRIAAEMIEAILVGSRHTSNMVHPRQMIDECAYHLDVFAQKGG